MNAAHAGPVCQPGDSCTEGTLRGREGSQTMTCARDGGAGTRAGAAQCAGCRGDGSLSAVTLAAEPKALREVLQPSFHLLPGLPGLKLLLLNRKEKSP